MGGLRAADWEDGDDGITKGHFEREYTSRSVEVSLLLHRWTCLDLRSLLSPAAGTSMSGPAMKPRFQMICGKCHPISCSAVMENCRLRDSGVNGQSRGCHVATSILLRVAFQTR